ncbi:MAG: tRNA (adenosine(37)-N6)-threonylcarbamoyltransferase complex transferase subunit TsaD [Candidatus Moraniibacteriota bacterium]
MPTEIEIEIKTKKKAKQAFLILAIETSCDETAISIVRCENNKLEILSNQISSQVKLHAKWGGVVPNLAAREHVKNIDLMLKNALQEANVNPADIDVISVTNGPGLIPALMVGVNYAKTLSYLWEKPLLPIHHIEGHIYANFISDKIGVSSKQNSSLKNNIHSEISNFKFQISNSPNPKFPLLALVVSGGHTQLILMRDHLQYEIIGQTVDDAVGEAFDKVARILGIGYPGGPAVAKWVAKYESFKHLNIQTSEQANKSKKNNTIKAEKLMPKKLVFPRPMFNKPNFNFSFSGLKTAVLYETKKHPELLKDSHYIAQVCHEFQQACVDVLIAKTLKAAEKYQPKTILLAGGVSANTQLRQQLGSAIEHKLPNVSYCIPALTLTGDNATMIASAGAFRWQKMNASGKKSTLQNWKTLQPKANLSI